MYVLMITPLLAVCVLASLSAAGIVPLPNRRLPVPSITGKARRLGRLRRHDFLDRSARALDRAVADASTGCTRRDAHALSHARVLGARGTERLASEPRYCFESRECLRRSPASRHSGRVEARRRCVGACRGVRRISWPRCERLRGSFARSHASARSPRAARTEMTSATDPGRRRLRPASAVALAQTLALADRQGPKRSRAPQRKAGKAVRAGKPGPER
jgi:hypothetical protein